MALNLAAHQLYQSHRFDFERTARYYTQVFAQPNAVTHLCDFLGFTDRDLVHRVLEESQWDEVCAVVCLMSMDQIATEDEDTSASPSAKKKVALRLPSTNQIATEEKGTAGFPSAKEKAQINESNKEETAEESIVTENPVDSLGSLVDRKKRTVLDGRDEASSKEKLQWGEESLSEKSQDSFLHVDFLGTSFERPVNEVEFDIVANKGKEEEDSVGGSSKDSYVHVGGSVGSVVRRMNEAKLDSEEEESFVWVPSIVEDKDGQVEVPRVVPDSKLVKRAPPKSPLFPSKKPKHDDDDSNRLEEKVTLRED